MLLAVTQRESTLFALLFDKRHEEEGNNRLKSKYLLLQENDYHITEDQMFS